MFQATRYFHSQTEEVIVGLYYKHHITSYSILNIIQKIINDQET